MKIYTQYSKPRSGNALRLVIASSLVVSIAAFAENMPVSPGDLLDFHPANSACPTFSWSSDSKSGVELVVAASSAPEDTALTQELPKGANSWTPPANRCLPPGRYVWYIRNLDAPHGDWSDALGFEVASLPTLDEVEKARQVLERFITEGGAVSTGYSQTASGQAINSLNGVEIVEGSARRNSTVAAVSSTGSGTNSNTSGQSASVSTAALSGISNSTNSAGVLAGNTSGGADLALDGAVQAQVTESQWQLNSASDQSFDFSNPSGDMTLTVNGEPVITSASSSANEPVSMFGAFGGPGTVDHTVAGTEIFDKTVQYYKNLTIPAGTTWVIEQPVAFIAVSGTCDIAGTITTELAGRTGGMSGEKGWLANGAPGNSSAGDGAGFGMHGGMHRVAVPTAISGAGGGGGGVGTAPSGRGGDGGGSEARGGKGGYSNGGSLNGGAAGVDWGKRALLTGGATDPWLVPTSKLKTDFFSAFLYFPGAGGGEGASTESSIGGQGGVGGGNVYLECRKAKFTGEITVQGEDGYDGIGSKAGGGGGGGGGIAVIRTLELIQNTGTIVGSGGLGGTGTGGGGNGGNGRMGVVEIVELQ